ncbi:MAG: hypothetical protein KDD69_18865 [Bdellovibrionales bacterium]|nr:hypothetical protein [Bdellovibrionales bacterium]
MFDVELPQRVALVFGSEGKGMRRLTKKHCDMVVHLPIVGSVESLNVSQAAAIVLYEVLRRATSA